jgi:hypothetical protein
VNKIACITEIYHGSYYTLQDNPVLFMINLKI